MKAKNSVLEDKDVKAFVHFCWVCLVQVACIHFSTVDNSNVLFRPFRENVIVFQNYVQKVFSQGLEVESNAHDLSLLKSLCDVLVHGREGKEDVLLILKRFYLNLLNKNFLANNMSLDNII